MERVLHDVELVCSSMLLACLFVFLLHCLWGADGVFLMKFFRVRQDRAENLKLCQLFFFFFLISPVACSLYWSLCALPAWHLMKQKGGAGGKSFFNFWVCSVWEREGDRMPPMEPPNPDSGCNYELLARDSVMDKSLYTKGQPKWLFDEQRNHLRLILHSCLLYLLVLPFPCIFCVCKPVSDYMRNWKVLLS